MEFRYSIPKHIQGYLEDVTEDDLSKIMTIMFELAINNGLLDSPKLTVEKKLDNLRDTLTQLIVNQRKDTVEILASIMNLSAKIENLNLIAAPRTYTADSSTAEVETVEFLEEELVIDEEQAVEELSEEEKEKRKEQGFLEEMLK